MNRRTLLQSLSVGLCLVVLAVLYLAAWIVTRRAFNRPRPLQMHKPKRT